MPMISVKGAWAANAAFGLFSLFVPTSLALAAPGAPITEERVHAAEVSVTGVTGGMAGAFSALKWTADGDHCVAAQTGSAAEAPQWTSIDADACLKARAFILSNSATLGKAIATAGHGRARHSRTLGQLRLLGASLAVNLMAAETCEDAAMTQCHAPELDAPSQLAALVRDSTTAAFGRLKRPVGR